MIRTFNFAGNFAGLVCSLVWACATVQAKDLLSPYEAERIGMVESWHRQVGAIGGAEAIVDIQIWVQKSIQRELIEVYTKGSASAGVVTERISLTQKDLRGRPIGKAEAERLAKNSILKLKRRGIEADFRLIKVDQVRLYSLTADGNLTALDAETGEQMWSIRLGRPERGYSSLGINDRFVTVLNGSSMYQVSAMDVETVDKAGLRTIVPAGRPSEAKRIDGVPLHGAVNSGDHALITTTRRGMETYLLGQPTIEPGFEMFSGKAITKPATYPNSERVMWPTDSSFVYVVDTSGQPSSLFRLGVDGNVEGGVAAASNNRFFFGCTGGRVYAVDATRSGQVLWNQSLGEPFYRVPFVTGDRVLMTSGYGSLHCLNAANGRPAWARPATDVDQVFAHVGNQLVGRDRQHHLVLVDEATGSINGRFNSVFVEKVVINQDTDRCYLVGKGGMVQCLRSSENELPVFLRAIKPKDSGDTGSAKPPTGQPAAPAADPFGAGAEPATPAADPFGAGAGEPMADPFGAAPGADPFGN
ncbi:MAG TPA: hypothetical protein DDZ51_00245 [Planctomycetaceae bacterium]|nr:hypothetical protein [Planctomycetaceae bacterium]